MPAWATIVLTLGAAAIAVAGTLGATTLQHRFARRERLAAEAAARRERASTILGPIETLLSDANPTRRGVNAGPKSQDVLDDLEGRWKPLRDDLAVLAASDADAGVSFAARRLSSAVHNTLYSGSYFVSDLLNPTPGGGRRDMREVAQADYRRALALLELLRDATRGDLDNAGERAATIDQEADAEHEALVNKISD